MKYYYEGVERLDWGFGNPNITAALIVQLMLLSWVFSFLKLKGKNEKFQIALFLLSLIVSTWFGILLIQTYSRGGLFASILCFSLLLLGILRYIKHRGFKKQIKAWKWKGMITCVMILILIVVSGQSRFNQRIISGVEQDRSVSTRASMYKTIPSMIVDSPKGWGKGYATEAYYQYYQPLQRQIQYQNLLSGHFTRLVEYDWRQRLLYVGSWLFALSICFPRRADKKSTNLTDSFNLLRIVCFLTVFSLLVADCFSFTTVSVEIIMPSVIAVVIAIGLEINDCRRQSINFHTFIRYWFNWLIRKVTLLIVGYAMFFAVLLSFNKMWNKHQVRYDGELVHCFIGQINASNTQFLIIQPQQAMDVYDAWGKAIRRAELSSVIIADINQFSSAHKNHCIVLAGDNAALSMPSFCRNVSVILLNPTVDPVAFFKTHPKDHYSRISVVYGEYVNTRNKSLWKNYVKSHDDVKFIIAEGAAEYIENWCDYLDGKGDF